MKLKVYDILILTIFAVFIFAVFYLASTKSNECKPKKIPFWDKKAGSPAERFELAKQSEPELIIFLRHMPKGGDLHNHLTGAAYSEYVLDNACKNKLNYNLNTDKFTFLPEKENSIISTTSLMSNTTYLCQFLNKYSMRGWESVTENVHEHFFNTFDGLVSSKYSVGDMLLEAINRNKYENLQYLELMAPCVPDAVIKEFKTALPSFEIHDLNAAFDKLKELTVDSKIKNKIKSYLDERDQYISKKLNLTEAITGNNGDLVIRYITALERTSSLLDFFVSTVVGITAMHADERIVGLNIVAPEDFPTARYDFNDQMKILDFLWLKMGNPNFTLHAGELTLKYSPVEPMRTRISESIKTGHALRIGHGVSIAWEDNPIELLEYMKQNKILVEICLSSNENVLNIKGDDHLFSLYRKTGVPVSLNTDDEGVNRSNLTMEYVKAVQRYNLSYEEIKELIRNSIEYSFLPGLSLYKNRDYANLCFGFESVRDSDWNPSPSIQQLMQKNPKLNREVRLERELVKFEKSLHSYDR